MLQCGHSRSPRRCLNFKQGIPSQQEERSKFDGERSCQRKGRLHPCWNRLAFPLPKVWVEGTSHHTEATTSQPYHQSHGIRRKHLCYRPLSAEQCDVIQSTCCKDSSGVPQPDIDAAARSAQCWIRASTAYLTYVAIL